MRANVTRLTKTLAKGTVGAGLLWSTPENKSGPWRESFPGVIRNADGPENTPCTPVSITSLIGLDGLSRAGGLGLNISRFRVYIFYSSGAMIIFFLGRGVMLHIHNNDRHILKNYFYKMSEAR